MAGLIIAVGSALPKSQAAFRDSTAALASARATDDPLLFETGSYASPELVWWLDAGQSSTLFSDAGCTSSTSWGGDVRCWKDRRLNGQTVTNSAATQAPRVDFVTMNGNRSVLFNCNTCSLAGPDLLGGSVSDITIFVVFRENTRRNNFLFSLDGYAMTGERRFTFHMPWSNGDYFFDPGNAVGDRVRVAGAVTAVGAKTLVTAWKDSTAGLNFMTVNRANLKNSASTSAGLTSGGLLLGGVDPVLQAGDLLQDHSIAEILVFDGVLPATDRGLIEDYLQLKWATG